MTNKPVVKVSGIEIAVNFYDNTKCSETCPQLYEDVDDVADVCRLFGVVLEDTKHRCQECLEKGQITNGEANRSI